MLLMKGLFTSLNKKMWQEESPGMILSSQIINFQIRVLNSTILGFFVKMHQAKIKMKSYCHVTRLDTICKLTTAREKMLVLNQEKKMKKSILIKEKS